MIVPPELERYVEEHSTPEEPLLAELAAETRASLPSPQMLSGPVAAGLLRLLVRVTGARRVLEIGTYSGYSALTMAAALPPGGRIDACELDPERVAFAQRWFDRSPVGDRITLHEGPALETIARLEGDFDLVFLDADKEGYVDYYEAVLPRLSERGAIVADNTLRGGSVADPAEDSEMTRAIRRFNEHVRADERSDAVVLSVRDGMTLITRTA